MVKLTLSAQKEVVARARKLAAANNTSISSMFERLIRLMSRTRASKPTVGPITRKATGLIGIPKGRTERQLLEDALLEKYDLSDE
jgi:hypothetical protein